MQKRRVIRIISRVPFRVSSRPYFLPLGVLPFKCINKLQIGILMHKLHSNLLPVSFTHWFSRNLEMHSHYTRSFGKYGLFKLTWATKHSHSRANTLELCEKYLLVHLLCISWKINILWSWQSTNAFNFGPNRTAYDKVWRK